MSTKKVIVVIVEGKSDQVSLEYSISNLIKSDKVHFHVINTDITTLKGNYSSNIIKCLNQEVNFCVNQGYFLKKDILRIVHIVDTDGVFCNKGCVKFKDIKGTEYTEECIYTNDVKAIEERNNNKCLILNRLYKTDKISNIPYSIYYFSTNLEHCLHNIQNASLQEKKDLSNQFEDLFYDNLKGFIDFMCNSSFSSKLDYTHSWEFIKKDNNSLNRYTNFNLFIKEFDKDERMIICRDFYVN